MAQHRATAHPVQAPKSRSTGSRGATGRTPSWLTPGRMLALVLLVGAVVAGVLIGVSVIGSSGSSTPSGKVTGSAVTATLLSGIPQQGTVLGSSSAPVTLVEYADLQCPYCARFATDTLPTLVSQYVRPGQLKIEFRGISFIGSDSEKALRAAVAAGAQNRLWNVLELLYRNQGTENSGWVTDGILRSIGASVRGLDVEKMLSDRSSAATTAALGLAARQAQELMGSRVQTPTFEIARTGSPLERLDLTSLDPAAFTPTIDALLGR